MLRVYQFRHPSKLHLLEATARIELAHSAFAERRITTFLRGRGLILYSFFDFVYALAVLLADIERDLEEGHMADPRMFHDMLLEVA